MRLEIECPWCGKNNYVVLRGFIMGEKIPGECSECYQMMQFVLYVDNDRNAYPVDVERIDLDD